MFHMFNSGSGSGSGSGLVVRWVGSCLRGTEINSVNQLKYFVWCQLTQERGLKKEKK